MRRHSVHGLVVLGLALGAISGCGYPLSKQIRAQAAKDLTFPMVLADPDAHRGRIVIWGGSIIQTTTLAKGSELLVLEAPLDSSGEPVSPRTTRGRFIVRAARFLDPIIFAQNSQITVGGEVAGKEARPLDKTAYTYPVIEAREIYLWPRYTGVYYPYPYPYYWGWHGPRGWWYDPFWGYGPYGGWYGW